MVDAGRVLFKVGIDRPSVDRAISDLEKRLAGVGDIDLKLPNTSAATGVAQQVESAFARIRTPDFNFSANTRQLEQAVNQARAQFADIESAIAAINGQRIEVDFRVKRGEADLARIEAQILKLQRQKIEIPVVSLEGAAKVRAIEADIERLNARKITIEADTSNARTQLSQLDQTLDGLRGDNAAETLNRLQKEFRETGDAASKAGKDTKSFNSILAGLSAGAASALISKLVEAFGALTSAVTGFVAASIQANAQLRNTENALTILLGSQEAAAESIQFLRDTSERTGQSFSALQQNYAGITAAAAEFGLPQEAVNELFAETSRVLGIFGKSSAESGLAFNALTQIFSKGQVSLEELRQQLGEQLPIALSATANGLKETGVLTQGTTSELLDLISTGLDAATFAEGWTRGLKQIEGEAPAAQQAIAGLENAIGRFQEALGASLDPIETAFSDTFAAILQNADLSSALTPLTEAGDRLREALADNPELAERLGEALNNFVRSGAEAVAGILDRITEGLSNPENVERFAESIENAGDLLIIATEAAATAGEVFLGLAGFFDNLIPGDAVIGGLNLLIDVLGKIIEGAEGAIKVLSGPGGLGKAISDLAEVAPGLGDLGGNAPLIGDQASQIGDAVDNVNRFGVAIGLAKTAIDTFQGARIDVEVGQPINASQLVPQQDVLDKSVRAARESNEQIASDAERTAKRSAQERAKADKEAAKQFEEAQKEALANIEIAQQNRIAAVRQNQAAGNLTADQADVQIAEIEADAIRDRIALREQEIAKVEEFASRQAISEKDAAEQIRSARQEIADLTLEGIEQEIQAQEAAQEAAERKAEEAKKSALEQLDAQQRLNDLQAEQVSIQSNIASTALQDQANLIGAQVSLEQSRLSLSRQNLEGKLAEAEAAEDVLAVEELRDRILLNQRQSIQAEFNAQREQLRIQEQLLQLDADRQKRLGEIAAAEARIAVSRAETNQASSDEIQELQGIVRATEQQAEAEQRQADAKLRGLRIQSEELNVAEELANQKVIQERREAAIEAFRKQQKDLADEQLKTEKELANATEQRARAADSLVSSLSGLQDAAGEDALSSLDRLEENLRSARRAGFGGQDASDLQRAINQAQSFARSGDGFSIDEAFRFARRNADNQFAGGVLDAVGLGGVSSFLDSQQEIALADSQIKELTGKLDEVKGAIEELEIPAGIQTLMVSTPDPVVDAAAVAAQVGRKRRIAGGRL